MTTKTPRWNLATSSYNQFHVSMGVPVRTSMGMPKWWGGAVEFVSDLRPVTTWRSMDGPVDDERRYRSLLYKRAEHVFDQLDELTAKYGPDQPLVMLCYENVMKGDYCHRTWAGRWLAEQVPGITIPELVHARGSLSVHTVTTLNPNPDNHDDKPRAHTEAPKPPTEQISLL